MPLQETLPTLIYRSEVGWGIEGLALKVMQIEWFREAHIYLRICIFFGVKLKIYHCVWCFVIFGQRVSWEDSKFV